VRGARGNSRPYREHFYRATDGIDDAAELADIAVPSALDDAAVVERNGRVNKVAAERPEARESPILVGAGKPAIADDVGHQDRG